MGNIGKESIRGSLIAVSALAFVLGAAAIGCGGGGGDSGSGGGTTNGGSVNTWGSSTAEVDTSTTSAELIQKCSRDDLPPITPDANGNFSFTAKYDDSPIIVQNAQYQGHVSGQTMQLTVTNPSTGNVIGSFNLTQGTTMPPYTGACPG
jgi:hypothetical protein